MIETLIAAILIPLGKKLGERWLDSAVEGLDNQLQQLLQLAVKSGQAADEVKVISYLHHNPDLTKKLDARTTELLDPSSAANAGLPQVASVGAKLAYYSILLEGLASIATKRGGDLILAGFLTGACNVTIVACSRNDLTFDRRSSTFINPPYGLELWVHTPTTLSDRDSCIEHLRRAAKSRADGTIPRHEIRSTFKTVARIYEGWVTFEGWTREDLAQLPAEQRYFFGRGSADDVRSLPEQMQRLMRIENYDGILSMHASAADLLRKEADDFQRLQRITLGKAE